MKDEELKNLESKLKSLRLKKERELKLATTKSQINKLNEEIKQLKKGEKNPSQFKKTFMSGLKTFGKGLGYGWRGIQKASNNLQRNDADFRRVARTKQSSKSPFSQEALMFYPKRKPVSKVSIRTPKKGKKKAKKKRSKRTKARPRKPTRQTPVWGLP